MMVSYAFNEVYYRQQGLLVSTVFVLTRRSPIPILPFIFRIWKNDTVHPDVAILLSQLPDVIHHILLVLHHAIASEPLNKWIDFWSLGLIGKRRTISTGTCFLVNPSVLTFFPVGSTVLHLGSTHILHTISEPFLLLVRIQY